MNQEFSVAVYYRYLLHADISQGVNSSFIHNHDQKSELSSSSASKRNVKNSQSDSSKYSHKTKTNTATDEAAVIVDQSDDVIGPITQTTAENKSPTLPIVHKEGMALTVQGPAPYMGNILDVPDMVWTEDVWTPERETEAQQRISEQGAFAPEFWRKKYENKAGAYWHEFYLRNTDKFYKDRHYLHVVFPEIVSSSWRSESSVGYEDKSIDHDKQPLALLEVGCGVGNAVLPLLELNPLLHVTAIDFAKSAIEILKKHPAVVATGRLFPFARCVVKDELPVTPNSMDLVLCMFVLSAIGPEHQLSALQKIASVLRPGGKLLVRDYGRYDEAQLRFKKGSKLAENFYVRQDGTCAYFFSEEDLSRLCEQAGLRCEEMSSIQRQYANRQQRAARYRVWIHAKFVKI